MINKALLVGGGGREDAISWKLSQSSRLGKLYVAPGNAGTARFAENVPIKATDIDSLLVFALKEGIEFTIVGQDDPLALGIVDAFQAKGLRIFGPTKAAAQIEASKVFSKRLMDICSVPTAKYIIIDDIRTASMFVEQHFEVATSLGYGTPIVIKASGLAQGKGAYPCRSKAEAEQAVHEIMIERRYGDSGDEIIIEKFVHGTELSIHAFSDGKSFKMFPTAQDHKHVANGDTGLMTGGMGTIAPVPGFEDREFKGAIGDVVVDSILKALDERDSKFVGLLYPGIKVSWIEGLNVLEFNARFGDPETQSYMRLLKTDLLEIMEACVDGRLDEINVEWNPGFAACIVMASEGYPSPDYKRGVPITGIEKAETLPGVMVFHAGTKMSDERLVTSGGRVIGVTGIGATLKEALDCAYAGVRCIRFEGMHYRKDIGMKSLNGQ